MLIQKTNPAGVDVSLQKFQAFIHSRLLAAWEIETENTSVYECYGRASRNKTSDGYIAEVFKQANSYKEVYLNKALHASSFFGLGARVNNENGTCTTDVHLVFFTDLEKLKPSIAHRADEEVRKDVLNACTDGLYGFTLESVETGVENALREYPGSRRDERLVYADMHPYHCFRLNFSLTYDINDCP